MNEHPDATQQDSLTAHVAGFISASRWEDIPADVVQLAKKSILDSLAVALSGSVAPATDVMRRYVRAQGCIGGAATVIGADFCMPPRFAALVNGTAMHADDFDDTWQATPDKVQGLHATVPVLAAVLAAAEPQGRSGRDVLTACIVGIEVGSRIFDAAHIDHIMNGYHCTGTSGMLGAAAGVANLYGLDTEATRCTLSLAATQTGTLLAQLGTMAKPFHSGLAAECALVSADLAAMGLTASPTILETRWGFFHTEGGGYDDHCIRGRLGRPWSFVDRGQWIKPWPTGSLGHPALTLMQAFVREHDLKPEQVAKIRVRTRQSIHDCLFHHSPKSELEAKFSLEFGLAVLLLERDVKLRHFSDEFVKRPLVQQTLAKVEFLPFPDAEGLAKGYSLVTSFVEIVLADGRIVSGRVDFGKGSKANPMTDEDVAGKFRDCAEYAGWPAAQAAKTIEIVRRLEDLGDVRELTSTLRAGDQASVGRKHDLLPFNPP